MKKITYILVSVMMVTPFISRAALTFGGVSSDRVAISSSSSLDNLSAQTVVMWVYPTTLTGSRAFFGSRGGPTNESVKRFDVAAATSELRLRVNHATTEANYTTNDGPLAVNSWRYISFTFDDAANPQTHIYWGTLTTMAKESTYATATNGVGAMPTESVQTHTFGNRLTTSGTFTTPFQGKIAVGLIFNRVLSLAEIRSLQFFPRCLSGCVGFYQFGFNGTGSQNDYSGKANTGTVTGATLSGVHVPIRLF